MPGAQRRGPNHSGSALLIAMLVLFIITALGLTLTLTSRIEGDISTNFRWSEMAFSHAEAGLEFGKNVLAGYLTRDGDFAQVLPPPRPPGEAMANSPVDTIACADASQPGCRDYHYEVPQSDGSVLFVGRVLRDVNGRLLQFDFRRPVPGDLRGDLDGDGSQDVQGTVTIWVRRPVTGGRDYAGNDVAVLTAEGTAPNCESAATGRPGSVKRLEITVSAPSSASPSDRYADPTKGSDVKSEAADAGQLTARVTR